jgi:hypothetical protein
MLIVLPLLANRLRKKPKIRKKTSIEFANLDAASFPRYAFSISSVD